MKRPVIKGIVSLVAIATILIGSAVTYKVIKWKAYIWLPGYIRKSFSSAPPYNGSPIHIIFLVVDHYEPGRGERGVESNRRWLRDYMSLADRHTDGYGRKLQHTWFYAYDHKNGQVVADLAKAVYEGYGEIEFHWHHGNDSNEGFRSKLSQAIRWFNSYGAMVTVDSDNPTAFGFIHGNWALDNSGPKKHCGVSRELDILKQAGCYADFTFPSLGHRAQPSKVNSIYYARDDDRTKSYDNGQDAAVGRRVKGDLLIFQGPVGLALNRQLFECGAIETDYVPTPSRVDDWISKGIRVAGRPEWIFIKVYTHGIQGREVFLSKETDQSLCYLERKYGTDRYQLHYVTAREAYNLVRAAEDGMSEDPDQYRNYELGEPINKVIWSSLPMTYKKVTQEEISLSQIGFQHGTLLFNVSPIVSVQGAVMSLCYSKRGDIDNLILDGQGVAEITSKRDLRLVPNAVPNRQGDLFSFEVTFNEDNKKRVSSH